MTNNTLSVYGSECTRDVIICIYNYYKYIDLYNNRLYLIKINIISKLMSQIYIILS